MGRYLDLDDVAATSELAISELAEMRAEIARLRAELLEALEPFVALLQSHNDTNEHGNPVPDNRPVFAINRAAITIGDLRKARAAIEAVKGESQ